MRHDVRLRSLTGADLPLVERWLREDHVRPAWGDPEANARLLAAQPADGHWRAIIEAAGRDVGLVLWQHPTREELDVAGLCDIPTSAIDIDVMIGEPDAVGLGVGPSAIGLVADAALADPAVPFVMACVAPDNHASLRAFTRAGFHRDREFDDVPFGRHVLLVRRRRPVGVA
jgi:aminoglycoside 6'-N-acetyltransferase